VAVALTAALVVAGALAASSPFWVRVDWSRFDVSAQDIKKKIEKLFELATDLKEQVEKTDSSKVLSLVLVKKAEEIEKLARDIKTKAKG